MQAGEHLPVAHAACGPHTALASPARSSEVQRGHGGMGAWGHGDMGWADQKAQAGNGTCAAEGRMGHGAIGLAVAKQGAGAQQDHNNMPTEIV